MPLKLKLNQYHGYFDLMKFLRSIVMYKKFINLIIIIFNLIYLNELSFRTLDIYWITKSFSLIISSNFSMC